MFSKWLALAIVPVTGLVQSPLLPSHTRQGLPVQAAAEIAPARADLPPRVAPTVPPRSTAPVLIATFGAKEKPFEVLRTVYSRETLTSFRDAVRASYPLTTVILLARCSFVSFKR